MPGRNCCHFVAAPSGVTGGEHTLWTRGATCTVVGSQRVPALGSAATHEGEQFDGTYSQNSGPSVGKSQRRRVDGITAGKFAAS